ncbi:MAG: hypothetical protein P8X95_18670 [Anaerolineales bacterium]
MCGSEAERLDVVYDKVVLNLRRLDHLFAQHVDDFDGEAGGGDEILDIHDGHSLAEMGRG